MSRIKGKDTKPEILVRKFLYSIGYRYRLHDNRLPGKPDIVISQLKKAIFIHGCYWHGHEGCKYYVPPKTRTDWWLGKINGNKNRDERNVLEAQKIGWQAIVIWECELKPGNRDATLEKLIRNLEN